MVKSRTCSQITQPFKNENFKISVVKSSCDKSKILDKNNFKCALTNSPVTVFVVSFLEMELLFFITLSNTALASLS